MPNPLLPVYDLRGASERCSLLRTLSINATQAGMDPNATVYVGQALSQSGANPAGGEYPVFYWCTYGTNLLILMLGVNSTAQAARIWQGYLAPRSTNPMPGLNQFWLDYAVAVRATIPNFVTRPTNITIVGHSAGGASAFVLSKLLFTDWNTTALTKVITFASPKVMAREQGPNYNLFAHADSCAWIAYDDPIPLIPPQSLTWTFAYGTGWLGGQLQRCQSFIPPQVGKMIGANLAITDGVVPSGINCPTTADFAVWYNQIGNNLDSSHALSVYAARLINALAISTIPQTPPVPTPVPPPSPTPTPAAVREAFAAERAVYTMQEGRNNEQIRAYPESALFEVVKQGNTWKVSFGGAIVAVGPGRKTAQGLARAGNDLIKRLQGQGGVDPSILVEQFTTLMSLATDPTSGFVPTVAPI